MIFNTQKYNMNKENKETIADIVSEVRRVAYNVAVADANTLNGWRPALCLSMLSDRIEDAHDREMADEKRISEAVVQSLRDKKLEMAGEIAVKDAEIAELRECLNEAIREKCPFTRMSCKHGETCDYGCGTFKWRKALEGSKEDEVK